MEARVVERAGGSGQRPGLGDPPSLRDVDAGLGEADLATAHHLLGDDEEVRIDVERGRLARATPKMKVVGQSAAACAQHEDIAEIAVCDVTNGFDGVLVLAGLAGGPAPVAIKVVGVFDDAARKAGRGSVERTAQGRSEHLREVVHLVGDRARQIA